MGLHQIVPPKDTNCWSYKLYIQVYPITSYAIIFNFWWLKHFFLVKNAISAGRCDDWTELNHENVMAKHSAPSECVAQWPRLSVSLGPNARPRPKTRDLRRTRPEAPPAHVTLGPVSVPVVHTYPWINFIKEPWVPLKIGLPLHSPKKL